MKHTPLLLSFLILGIVGCDNRVETIAPRVIDTTPKLTGHLDMGDGRTFDVVKIPNSDGFSNTHCFIHRDDRGSLMTCNLTE